MRYRVEQLAAACDVSVDTVRYYQSRGLLPAPEREGRVVRQVPARELWGRMMRTLAQTGNGWMTFKDASNLKANQTALPENVVHLSNLCTEIIEVTNQDETAVCNLGSVNLGRLVIDVDGTPTFDFDRLGEVVRTYTTVSRQGGSLKLLNLTKRIEDLLSITKLLTVFDTFDSEAEAIKSFTK